MKLIEKFIIPANQIHHCETHFLHNEHMPPLEKSVVHRRKLRVVIADDTRLVLRVCSCLVTECHRAELVGTAQNGAELLNVCRSACPDLVLVDVHMPVMNGLEAVASIRQEFPGMRVVFVTSDDSDKLRKL